MAHSIHIPPKRKEKINHPSHYNEHPSGVECIDIAEHMGFCLGNALKYIWRAELKNESPIEDLKKARWYLDREIKKMEGADSGQKSKEAQSEKV